MQTIFSTADVPLADRFLRWREFCDDRLVPLIQDPLGDRPFAASVEGAGIGGLTFTRFAYSAVRVATTTRTIRHMKNRTGALWVSLRLAGSMRVDQGGHSDDHKAGEFTVRDTDTPWTLAHDGRTKELVVELPRERLETMLGPASRFGGLVAKEDLPTTALARSYLCDLMRLGARMTPEAAERATSVGVDLIVAALAERMSLESPKPLHGTLTVQRAKAYIEANLVDTDLDPPGVAAAVGVSPRHLHALFRERGRSVAAWIWQRRLETAARRLSDPALLHVPIGVLAYGCGFVNQGHFSRRFGERFGMSPRDYRHAALTADAARTPRH